jgi:hypothetical protein
MKKLLVLFCILILIVTSLYSGNFKEHEVTIPLRFDYYYSYDMVVEALKKLHKAYPNLTKLDLVGKSEEGRAIYCMTVNNPKTGKELNKPGIHVDGNMHGNEIQAGEVALYLLDYLLSNYGSNEEITKLVDTKCFYVVPVVNVDGRYHFLADGNTCHDNRSIRRPHDDDKDGLLDEDPLDDLDKDGNICWMRKKDPNGTHKLDSEDPRIMVMVKPGEKGTHTLIGLEGIDNDGDGRMNEDSEGYVDPNRNYGYNWMPDYVQPGAGDYPFSGLGIKALAEFMKKRTNICMGWTFHNFGGMFVRGPSTKAHGEFHPQDVAVFDYLGEMGERIVPDYRYVVVWKALYETYGGMDFWMMMSLGAYSFTGELSVPEHETFKSRKEKKKFQSQTKSEDDEDDMDFFGGNTERERERLKFNDHVAQGVLFVKWKPYKHPTYGNIEIGGWAKLSTRLPHPFMIKDMAHRNVAAVIFSAKQTPDVTFEVFEKKKIGNDLYRIRTRLKNSKAMPTMTYHSQQVKLYPKDMLFISGQNITVEAGGKLLDPYRDQVKYKEHRPEIQFLFVPGFGKAEHQFLVSGKGKVTFTYKSRHAGNITKSINLE